MYALTDCTLYTGEQVLPNYALVIEGDRILELVPQGQLNPQVTQISAPGRSVAPGFIDLQLNGCGGVMFNDAITAHTLDQMHRTNLQSGTTSFLPTLITTSEEAMDQAIALVKDYRHQFPDRVLGLHLEGPYLNPKRKGIHPGSSIRPASAPGVKRLVEAGPEVVRLVTLAPELVPQDYIQQLAATGIVVSAGHTDASFEQGLAGFEAGVSMVTHLFNAMSPWLGRQPGMVGAVFSRPEVYAGIIADGHHVHYGSIRLAQAFKQDRLILVSDATAPVGTVMDSFTIGGQTVFYRQGKCISAEGTLGGSALTLIEAVKNCVQQVGLELAEALRMASLYPARAIGLDHRLGRLAPGYTANLVAFDPERFTIQAVVDQGQMHQGD
ncbi:MAG TPA: N-acetylglucosamine-6-phosphate deacetylase [Leptolyngbyaceae cyanobacterium M65_K2018_010]|nr:N-acetylglucosamine-6-phosphate deacetylase [Leptolyngbyaceae cyanobacterium M65_K2018_010]